MFGRNKKRKEELEEVIDEELETVEELDENNEELDLVENEYEGKSDENTSDEDAKKNIEEGEDDSVEEELEPIEETTEENQETHEEEDLEETEEETTEDEVEEKVNFISTKNYDDAVVKLINEVKIFNDDADDLGFNKKRRILPVILFLLLLVGIAVGVYYLFFTDNDIVNKKEEKKEEKSKEENAVNYRYEETDAGITFYNGDELLVTYECEECKPYAVGRYEFFSDEPTVLAIQSADKVFLYDYTKEEVISEEYTQMKNLKEGDETLGFIVADKEGIFGVIDTKGEVVIPIEYEALGYATSGGDVSDYSYDDNFITAKKDGYWGAINFKGEEVIPFEYEDIYFNGYDSIVVCIEGLWYLYDLNNEQLIEKGYNIMIPIKSYVFASVDNVFYILNYKGESIVEKEIATYLSTFRDRERAITPTFKIEEEGTIVNIYIMKDDTTYEEYKFNTVNGELTEIIQ